MSLLNVAELMAYWANNPPTHVLLAALLGFDPSGQKPAQAAMPQQMPDEPGQGFRRGDVHAGLGAAMLDIARLRQRGQGTKI